MTETNAQIIDANINRASEGLRVIEDFLRFSASEKSLTDQLAAIRKGINATETDTAKRDHLLSRDTHKDMRAKEVPTKRKDTVDILKANFKRVEEALRVLEEYTGNAQYNGWRYDLYELEKAVILRASKPEIKRGVYLISHDPEILKKGLEWEVSLIQIRDKEGDKAGVLKAAKIIAPLAKKKGIPFIINDYLDIALLVNADGLHTGQDDISVREQRRLLGDDKIIGRTTHTLEQGLEAQSQGADYISIGPIWETPSKPGREAIGFEYLKKAKDLINIPYVAIGGIDITKSEDVLSYHPPLIGLIRDVHNIPLFQEKFRDLYKV